MIKEKLNKINWNKVQITSIKVLFIAILNTPLWVYLIGNFVPYGTIGEFRLSWIDYLKLSDKVEWYQIWILYSFIPIGILLSIGFIKWLIAENVRDKKDKKLLEENKKQMEEIIKSKEDKKIERDIDKYL